MIKTVALFITTLFLSFFFFADARSNNWHEVLLLDGMDSLAFYGLDTTGHRWAITKPFHNKYRLYIDDFSSPALDDLSFPIFSPDGIQWAFYSSAGGSIQFYHCAEDDQIYMETLDATDFGEITFSPDGRYFAYTYYQGDNEIINLPFRQLSGTYRWGNLFIDNSGSSFTILGQRGSRYVININGRESSTFDSIIPIGYWNNGNFVYAVSNGSRWEVYRGKDPTSARQLGTTYSNIIDASINYLGTTMALLVRLVSGRSIAILFSDEYRDPVYGRSYDAVWGLVLHPTELLYGYGAANMNRTYVVQNSTEYFATADIGTPFYTHNGDELIFIGRGEYEPFISINGQRINVKIALYSDDKIAKKPHSPSIALRTNVSLVTYFYERDRMITSNMYDRLSNPIYNRRKDSYQALATIYNRLYLIEYRF